MSIECVLIKEEPNFELESNEGECNNYPPDFISIKIENSEIEPSTSEIRIKQEPASRKLENEEQGTQDTSQVKSEPVDTAEDEKMQPEEFVLQPEIYAPMPSNNELHPRLLDTGRFSCPLCQKLFKTKGHALRHLQSHTTQNLNDPSPKLRHDGLYSCSICQKSFTNKYHANRHTLIHNRQTYECPTCNKTFNKDEQLQRHSLTHATKCKECGEMFAQKSDLIEHKKFHVKSKIKNIENVSCPVCNKSFNQPGLLKPHMRKHTGEKPFECVVCKKTFAHKHNMQRHELRHKKVKITTCYICKKTFPKESHLKYHMRTHVTQKFFECQVCNKTFSHKKNIVRHFSRKHPNDSYEGDLTDAAVATTVWREVINKKEAESDSST